MTAQPDPTATQRTQPQPRPSDASDSPVPPSKEALDRDHMEDKLDEALKESFPASDPIAVTPGDR